MLDFGLAKAIGAPAPGDSPTITLSAATSAGTIVGTAAYMSPEQARGEPVDRRSDIWAFGAVLYEMLTGRRAFGGGSITDVLSAVISADPDWSALPSDVPTAIRTLLHGCLRKNRNQRVADISTARFVFDAASSLSGSSLPAPTRSHRWFMALATSTALLAVLSLGLLWTLLEPEPAIVTRYTVTPAAGQEVVDATGIDIALSPDGSWMVYVGSAPRGGRMLLRRNLDDLDAVAIPGTEGASAPVVSPDGRAIAFLAEDGIRTIPVEGGTPFTVVTGGGQPAWGDDGFIYFSGGPVVYRVPAQGGEPVAFTSAVTNVVQLTPDPLPGGRGLLVTLLTGTVAQARLAVVGPEGGEPRAIRAGAMARYSPTGHVVFTTANGALLAAPFDLGSLKITGGPVPLAEGVIVAANAPSDFAVSRSGAFLYATGASRRSELVWVTRDGTATPIDPTWIAEFGSPVLSPDGTRLAVAIQGAESRDIWVTQLDHGPRHRLTLDGDRNDYPVWSPDGRLVTFTSDRASPSFDLWSKKSDGTGEPVLEIDEEWAIAEALWSPDRQWFLHRTSSNVKGAGDILARRLDGDSKPRPIVNSEFMELAPALSPNSRWLAYSSNETGRSEVFVVPFPNAEDSKWPISVNGGSEPLWSRSGDELFYRNGKGDVVSVRVKTEGPFAIGATTVLFPGANYLRAPVNRQYDVTRDGRFVMIRPISAGREPRLTLVRNALKGLPPGDGH